MHALDHVGPIEHQRLVALPLQPAIVLLRQLKLLERRTHPAVKDDDPLANRVYEISLRHELRRVRGHGPPPLETQGPRAELPTTTCCATVSRGGGP